jgi:hypothetical protein
VNAPPLDAQDSITESLSPILKESIAWSGQFLRIGTTTEKSWDSNNKAATKVNAFYGPPIGTKSRVPRELTKELLGEDYDPKVLQWAKEGYANFGDTRPWARFHGDLQHWLEKLHLDHPIRLVHRPTPPEVELSGLHHKSLLSLLESPILKEIPSPQSVAWMKGFILELMAQTASISLTKEMAHNLLPILTHSFGIDHYGQAATRTFHALNESDQEAFLGTLAEMKKLRAQILEVIEAHSK